MCNKIIIIKKGKIVRIDETANIEGQASTEDSNEIIITVEEEKDKLSSIRADLKQITNIKLIEENGKSRVYSLKYEGQEDIRKDLFKACVAHDITIIEMKKKEVSLEDAFLKITEEEEKK